MSVEELEKEVQEVLQEDTKLDELPEEEMFGLVQEYFRQEYGEEVSGQYKGLILRILDNKRREGATLGHVASTIYGQNNNPFFEAGPSNIFEPI